MKREKQKRCFPYIGIVCFLLLFLVGSWTYFLFFKQPDKKTNKEKEVVATIKSKKSGYEVHMEAIQNLNNIFECPDGMVPLSGGESDVVWVKGEEGNFKRIHSHLYKIEPFCMDKYEFPNKKYSLPVVNVSFLDAKENCAKVKKRLCTEKEWEYACTSGAGWEYCYGEKFVPWRCKTTGVVEGDAESIAPAGSHAGCVNRFGVFDLNGNVSEWVDATEPGNMGVVRGGTAWVSKEYGQSCFSRHLHQITDNKWPDDGFRCCTNAKKKNDKNRE